MDRVIFFGSVRGGVVDMLFNSRICDRPCFCPVGLGSVVVEPCNFWKLCQFSITALWWCWVVCFWLGFGLFTALFLAETFVESLILAQDERWRRA